MVMVVMMVVADRNSMGELVTQNSSGFNAKIFQNSQV